MVNIYKVNDCDWVAAESLNAAAEFYRSCTGEEIDHEEAYQLSDEELDQRKFKAEEGVYGLKDGTYTFREALAGAIKEGDIPCLFASTEQ